jgi:hypothetical protein
MGCRRPDCDTKLAKGPRFFSDVPLAILSPALFTSPKQSYPRSQKPAEYPPAPH